MSILRKRGVSEIVSYVLLISISIAIAGVVFSWLRLQATPSNEIDCEEGVSLVISEYYYNCTGKVLNLTLKNRGLFDIDGYVIRVNNVTNSKLGVYLLNGSGGIIDVGDQQRDSYSSEEFCVDMDCDSSLSLSGDLTFVEAQVYTIKEGKRFYCKNIVAKQSLSCS